MAVDLRIREIVPSANRHVRVHENASGIKPPRRGAGHGGADRNLPRLIAGGAHHPAMGRGAPTITGWPRSRWSSRCSTEA